MMSAIQSQSENESENKRDREIERGKSVQTWQIINEGMYNYLCTILSILLYDKKFENTSKGNLSM